MGQEATQEIFSEASEAFTVDGLMRGLLPDNRFFQIEDM